ncbi:MAG: substrate-binding domain-containing protein, partial [Rhodobacteraceae bacterium]|nr:substrate-binding domain-containing protein [Paracoccaceae bacterium]
MRKSAAVSVALLLWFSAAYAQEITLVPQTGGAQITGDFLSYDGTFLRIATQHGDLTLDYSAVVCTGAACPDGAHYVAQLRASGAPRLAELILPALIEGYARDAGLVAQRDELGNGRVDYLLSAPQGGAGLLRFELRSTTTQDAIGDLLANEADIALAARALNAAELSMAREAGFGALDHAGQVRVLAYDALVPAVSPRQQTREISTSALLAAFAGEITDWQELGGAPGPIHLYLGGAESGQVQAFEQNFLGQSGRALAMQATYIADLDALAARVADDPAALGLLPVGITGNAQAIEIAEECGLRYPANMRNIKTLDYPLTFPLYLYLPRRNLHQAAQNFLGWLGSPAAERVLRRARVAGLEPVLLP